jgi:hypothetical protein
LSKPLKDLAVGAVRLAAMAQLGPLAGGVFLAGGAIVTKILAESEWATATAEMLMHLGAETAKELFGSAVEGFRSGSNSDLEKSMHAAARLAFDRLQADAPPGFDDWFNDWKNYLTLKPTAEVFAGARDVDPIAVEYDDGQFRQFWWSRMEPVLLGWRESEKSTITQLHLNSGERLPAPLSA